MKLALDRALVWAAALTLLTAIWRMTGVGNFEFGNFSPAYALFFVLGARLPLAKAFAFSLLGMLLSDAVLGFHSGMWVVYGSLGLIGLLGYAASKQKFMPEGVALALSGTLGAVLFYLTTNFAVWLQGSMYPMTAEGLKACFIAAIPFFRDGTLPSMVVFASVFLVSHALFVGRKSAAQAVAAA
jgi:hypothetical protein